MGLFGCKSCNNCPKVSCNDKIPNDLSKVVLVGNPNVGKSVIFNALSGFYVEVSNFPGTTVDVSKAFTSFGEVIDTPGAYGLGNYSDDEIVTQNIIKTADVIVNVVSALSIDRDLFLTQQLLDMDFPVILVVNQMDEAQKRGLEIDCNKLESIMGIKVLPAVAIHNTGISDIINAIKNKEFKVSQKQTPYLKEMYKDKKLTRNEKYLEILEIEMQETKRPEDKEKIHSQRRQLVDNAIEKVICQGKKRFSFSVVIGNLLLNPVIGFIVAVGMLLLLYNILGVLVAGNTVDFLYKILEEHYTPWITSQVLDFSSITWLNEILVGEFGILTMTVNVIVGVLIPLVSTFYLFMAMLEDSGYLPRLAVLTDNVLNKLGLNGRAVIPLLLGFGCGTMGALTTRILGSKKERTIATAILGVTIPCAAQQGLIIALLAVVGGFKVWVIYIACIFSILVLVGTVLNKLIKGKPSDLLIDLPPMRMPLFVNTIHKIIFRISHFLQEAVLLFVLGSILITLLKFAGFLEWLQEAMSPIVVHMLNLPAEFSNIFVMGFIRRDFASVGLLGMAGFDNTTRILSDLQILVATVVITLFVPCFAAIIVICKERGVKEASLVWVGTIIISIIVGSIVSHTMGFLF